MKTRHHTTEENHARRLAHLMGPSFGLADLEPLGWYALVSGLIVLYLCGAVCALRLAEKLQTTPEPVSRPQTFSCCFAGQKQQTTHTSPPKKKHTQKTYLLTPPDPTKNKKSTHHTHAHNKPTPPPPAQGLDPRRDDAHRARGLHCDHLDLKPPEICRASWKPQASEYFPTKTQKLKK